MDILRELLGSFLYFSAVSERCKSKTSRKQISEIRYILVNALTMVEIKRMMRNTKNTCGLFLKMGCRPEQNMHKGLGRNDKQFSFIAYHHSPVIYLIFYSLTLRAKATSIVGHILPFNKGVAGIQ